MARWERDWHGFRDGRVWQSGCGGDVGAENGFFGRTFPGHGMDGAFGGSWDGELSFPDGGRGAQQADGGDLAQEGEGFAAALAGEGAGFGQLGGGFAGFA